MSDCSLSRCDCNLGYDRRDFLQMAALLAAGAILPGRAAVAGPFTKEDFEKLVPVDKKLARGWVESLTARGEPTIYRNPELDYIGMPVGGFCTGQLYLGGDGRLLHWDIFNAPSPNDFNLYRGPHYAVPIKPTAPLEQGFAVKVTRGGKSEFRRLDKTGFPGVTFCGQYPIGTVTYHDPACPVNVKLEAYSPFIPLDAEDSGLPATIMEFSVTNTSAESLEVELAGWLENAVCKFSKTLAGVRRNQVVRDGNMLRMELSAHPDANANDLRAARRPDIVFADFEESNYGEWKVEGTAFGTHPAKLSELLERQSPKTIGAHGQALADSFAPARGAGGGKESATGKLTSPEFTIERNYIRFLIGGGENAQQLGLRLIIDGKTVCSATGHTAHRLRTDFFDTKPYIGRKARLEIFDDATGGWGCIGVDYILFTDLALPPEVLAGAADYGTLCLTLLAPEAADRACADAGDGNPEAMFQAMASGDQTKAEKILPARIMGAAGRRWTLKPNEQRKATFVITWHFPQASFTPLLLNDTWSKIRDIDKLKRYYAERFRDANDVAVYVAKNFARLSGGTRRWHDTWYDSTLPHWLLDRMLMNVSVLATATCHRFDNGRYWFFEGTYCCPGNCTSVWFYTQGAGRLFPSIEQNTHETQHFVDDLGLDPKSGGVWTRGEYRGDFVLDGQSGHVLTAYRTHQMSTAPAFLRRNWPTIRKILQWLIHEDGNADGIIDGKQSTTLDTGLWWGAMSWTSSLYLAALRAGEEMAREMGDEEFAKSARTIADAGAKNLVERLWNGEYFIHKPDSAHPNSFIIGNGCHIDQVFGQGWANQVGLGRILPERYTQSALRAIWKYNFTPDVGPYRQIFKEGSWYAMPGEGGTIMTTWPHGDRELPKVVDGDMATGVGYLNTCMAGYEHQVASHMVSEGLVVEGLAAERVIHDRYHASRRNPWNEVECGDHYSRGMASYGILISVSGYEYHGPKGHIGFAPRLTPENFRAPFTSAEGWGSFWQKQGAGRTECGLQLRWGKLHIKTFSLGIGSGAKVSAATVLLAKKAIPATLTRSGDRALITFATPIQLTPETELHVTFA